MQVWRKKPKPQMRIGQNFSLKEKLGNLESLIQSSESTQYLTNHVAIIEKWQKLLTKETKYAHALFVFHSQNSGQFSVQATQCGKLCTKWSGILARIYSLSKIHQMFVL